MSPSAEGSTSRSRRSILKGSGVSLAHCLLLRGAQREVWLDPFAERASWLTWPNLPKRFGSLREHRSCLPRRTWKGRGRFLLVRLRWSWSQVVREHAWGLISPRVCIRLVRYRVARFFRCMSTRFAGR